MMPSQSSRILGVRTGRVVKRRFPVGFSGNGEVPVLGYGGLTITLPVGSVRNSTGPNHFGGGPRFERLDNEPAGPRFAVAGARGVRPIEHRLLIGLFLGRVLDVVKLIDEFGSRRFGVERDFALVLIFVDVNPLRFVVSTDLLALLFRFVVTSKI